MNCPYSADYLVGSSTCSAGNVTVPRMEVQNFAVENSCCNLLELAWI